MKVSIFWTGLEKCLLPQKKAKASTISSIFLHAKKKFKNLTQNSKISLKGASQIPNFFHPWLWSLYFNEWHFCKKRGTRWFTVMVVMSHRGRRLIAVGTTVVHANTELHHSSNCKARLTFSDVIKVYKDRWACWKKPFHSSVIFFIKQI